MAKIADDLFVGANNPEDLLSKWAETLQALNSGSLRLSSTKTVICPRSTRILGWIWTQGQLSADPHTIHTVRSCPVPTTVKGMRSFIGVFKALARVITSCASYMAPLNGAISSFDETSKTWPDDVITAFHKAQKALDMCRSIYIPRPSDELWIATDAASSPQGLGAVMYVKCDDRILPAGFFCVKLRQHQTAWLP